MADRHYFAVGVMLFAAFGTNTVVGAELSADAISQAAGADAAVQADGVVRISWPRNDVALKVDGVRIMPFAGVGSWAAFMDTPHGAMVMGDTVVFEDEVDVAMDAAFANGLEVTALHNHFFHAEPPVFFMHIGGRGEAEALASGVKAVWDAVRAVRSAAREPADAFSGDAPVASGIDAARLEAILGVKAQTADGMVKFTIGREGAMHGVPIGGSMGLTTWASFTGNDATAVMAGDFIMGANEVQPVLRALRATGIHVVALHNHMIGEEPAMLFVHYWGKGGTKELAQGIKTALDAQAAAK